MRKYKVISKLLLVAFLVTNILMLPVGNCNKAEAVSQTITFSESKNSTQSKTITIPNLKKINSISVNTGNVNYKVDGDNLTITVSNGSPSRTAWDPYKYSKSVSDYKTSSSNSFSNTISYSDASGYSGTMYKNGSSYVVSGTPADSKAVTQTRSSSSNSFPSSISYNSGGYSGTLYKSGSSWSSTYQESKTATDYKTSSSNSFPNTISYSDGSGYRGTLYKNGSSYVSSGSYTPAESKTVTQTKSSSSDSFPSSISYNSGGYSGTLYKNGSSTKYLVSGSPGDSKYVTRVASYNGSIDETHQNSANRLKRAYSTIFVSENGYSGSIPWNNWSSGGWGSKVVNWFYYWGKASKRSGTSLNSTSYAISTLLNYYRQNGCNNPRQAGAFTWYSDIYYDSSDGLYHREGDMPVRCDYPIIKVTYAGTITKPDTRVWNYRQSYSGTVTRPASDTRVWRQNYSGTVYGSSYTTWYQSYSGTAYRPDTRIWRQNYSGTAYKGGNTNYYSYTVSLDYTAGDFNIHSGAANTSVSRGQTLHLYAALINQDNQRVKADSITLTLPNGQILTPIWDISQKRYNVKFLVPSGGSPGSYPGNGNYVFTFRATKDGVTKTARVNITITGNIAEKVYIRTIE